MSPPKSAAGAAQPQRAMSPPPQPPPPPEQPPPPEPPQQYAQPSFGSLSSYAPLCADVPPPAFASPPPPPAGLAFPLPSPYAHLAASWGAAQAQAQQPQLAQPPHPPLYSQPPPPFSGFDHRRPAFDAAPSAANHDRAAPGDADGLCGPPFSRQSGFGGGRPPSPPRNGGAAAPAAACPPALSPDHAAVLSAWRREAEEEAGLASVGARFPFLSFGEATGGGSRLGLWVPS